MKTKHLSYSLILTSLIVGCASNNSGNSNLQMVVDPSYNFIVENNNKVAPNSFINIKIISVKSGLITATIVNNVFNINSDVILFKVGDKITINYTNLGVNCSYNNAKVTNYKGDDTVLNAFALLNGDDMFSCTPKSSNLGLNVNGEIYTLKVINSNTLPILNGVSVPDISKTPKDNIYSLYKVVTPNSKFEWIPTSVFDNGIQTYIKFGSFSKSSYSKFMVYNNYGGNKAIHINFKVEDDGIIVDGVYNNITLIYLSDDLNRGEISILRQNVPNSDNSLVNSLYTLKDNFYKQDFINQQGSVANSVYQPSSNTNSSISLYNKQNKPQYNDDLAIATANNLSSQSNNPVLSATDVKQMNSSSKNMLSSSQNTQLIKVRGSDNSVPPLSGGNNGTVLNPVSDNNLSQQNSPPLNDDANLGSQNSIGGISIMNQLDFGTSSMNLK